MRRLYDVYNINGKIQYQYLGFLHMLLCTKPKTYGLLQLSDKPEHVNGSSRQDMVINRQTLQSDPVIAITDTIQGYPHSRFPKNKCSMPLGVKNDRSTKT